MPSDLTVYTPEGRAVRTTRRAYERIHKAKGWRLTPPKPKSAPPSGGAESDATSADNQEG